MFNIFGIIYHFTLGTPLQLFVYYLYILHIPQNKEEQALILKTIKKYVGEVIYYRGLNYYRRNHIIHLLQKSDIIFAKVQGRGRNIYSVEISLRNDAMEEAFCDCPYGALCKHIAAVLISYCLEKSKTEPINPMQVIREQEYPDKIISLIQKNRKSTSASEFIKSLTNNQFPLSLSKNSQRWRLVFFIQRRDYYYAETENYWIIAPALQYIKQDGSPGRIARWRSGLITEEVTDNDQALLNKLMESSAKEDKLTSYLDWIINNKDLPLFVQKDYHYIPIVFKELNNAYIFFRIHKINQDEPLFRPLITLYNKQAHPTYTHNMDIYPVKTMEFLVLICSSGILFFRQGKGHTSQILYKLLKGHKYFNSNDIYSLKTYVETHCHKELKVIFQSHKILLTRQPPQPILEIRRLPQASMLFITLIFNYSSKEIFPNDNRDFFIIKDEVDDNEIWINKRNRDLEKKIIRYLRFKLGEHLDSRSFWDNQEYDFIVSLEIRDFLLQYGEVLLQEGYGIKIEGKPLRRLSRSGNFSIAVSPGIDWLDMQYNYYDEQGQRQEVSFDLNYLEKGLLASKQGFILLTSEYIKRLKRLLEQGLNNDGTLRVSKLNFALIDELSSDVDLADMPQIIDNKKIYAQLKDFHKIKKYPLVQSFKASLRNYQKAGYYWLRFLHEYKIAGCLADDMGLGKTVQT